MASSAPDVPEDVVDLDALDDTGAHRHFDDIWQYYKKIKLDKAHAEHIHTLGFCKLDWLSSIQCLEVMFQSVKP